MGVLSRDPFSWESAPSVSTVSEAAFYTSPSYYYKTRQSIALTFLWDSSKRAVFASAVSSRQLDSIQAS